MDRYVPLEKRSKKEQRKFHAMQRSTWLSHARTASASSSRTAREMNGLNPVTRIVPYGKAYDRKQLKAMDRKSSRRFDYEERDPAVFVFAV